MVRDVLRQTVAVLPAYNLEKKIAVLVTRTKQFADSVIVVADGSSDKTSEFAQNAGAIVPAAESVRGKGFALIKGITLAKTLAPQWVVVMDADGQHLPEEIPNVLAPLMTEDIDMVVGSRMMGTLRTSTINKFGNVVLKIISFLCTGKWLTDTESGFRAFRASRLFELNLNTRGYEIETELLFKAMQHGFKIKEVPIHVPIAVPGATVADGLKIGWYKLKCGIKMRLGRSL